MKVRRLEVQNYRGCKKAVLEKCGSFNVLIGRNNSGKSTLLSAINIFFRAMDEGSPIAAAPYISIPDFCDKEIANPIALACELEVDNGERERILALLSEENPQLRTVVETAPNNANIHIEVKFLDKPQPFFYLSRIRFVEKENPTRDWVIFEMGQQAADELGVVALSAEKAAEYEAQLNSVRGITEDDWTRLKKFEVPPRILRTEAVSNEILRQIQNTANLSQSREEFLDRLQTLIAEYKAEQMRAASAQTSHAIKTFSGQQRSIPFYITKILELVGETRVLYLTERRRPIGAAEAQRLLDLKTRRGGTSTLNSIQETVSELLGVKVDAFSSEENGRRDRTATAELDVDNFLVEMNGSGIRESLRVVLDTTFEKPNILLVEEPEIHLHPGLEIGMMRFLQKLSSECQVFITTHSTNFLDRGTFQKVYLTTKDKYASASLLDVDEIEKKVPQELGVRLSSLFMYDRLVFVEGISDELVIRELANVLRVNLNQMNVGFIPLQGIGNLGHYAAKEIIDFLAKRQVKMWFLIDRDEKANEEIQRIRDRLGSQAIFCPSQARELENYLLNAEAIAAHINSRKPSGSDIVKISDVQRHIVECADKLKSLVVWKHIASLLKPVHIVQKREDEGGKAVVPKDAAKADIQQAVQKLNDLGADIDKKVDAVTRGINERWNRDRLLLVPGAALLDEIYKKYGLRFDKVRDAPKLASKVAQKDLDDDLKKVLNQIGANN